MLIRSLIFQIIYLATGMMAGTLALIMWLFPVKWRFAAMMTWVRFAMWWLCFCCKIKIDFKDLNESPPPNPFMVMAKHQTEWETLHLQRYFAPLSTIVKRELLWIPFFGWGLALLKPIKIDRSSPLQALKRVKKMGIKHLKEGFNVMIFPEGTRKKVGETGEYARSGVEIAKAAGVPIVPVAHNAGYCWPAKSLRKRSGTISVVVGKPIDTSERSSKEIIAEVKEWIEGEVRQMAPFV